MLNAKLEITFFREMISKKIKINVHFKEYVQNVGTGNHFSFVDIFQPL